jgi:hypothetical protein
MAKDDVVGNEGNALERGAGAGELAAEAPAVASPEASATVDDAPEVDRVTCQLCAHHVERSTTYRVNGQIACAPCVAGLRAGLAAQTPRARALPGALIGGLAGALVGAAVWAAIAVATQFEVGYVAVLVGFLAGVGVRFGARAQRGPLLQGVAVGLALVGLAAAKYMIIAYEFIHYASSQGVDVGVFDGRVVSAFPDVLAETIGPLDALFVFLAMSAAFRVLRPVAIQIVKEG